MEMKCLTGECTELYGMAAQREEPDTQLRGRAEHSGGPGQDPFPGKTIQAGDTTQSVEWLPHNVRT